MSVKKSKYRFSNALSIFCVDRYIVQQTDTDINPLYRHSDILLEAYIHKFTYTNL